MADKFSTDILEGIQIAYEHRYREPCVLSYAEIKKVWDTDEVVMHDHADTPSGTIIEDLLPQLHAMQNPEKNAPGAWKRKKAKKSAGSARLATIPKFSVEEVRQYYFKKYSRKLGMRTSDILTHMQTTTVSDDLDHIVTVIRAREDFVSDQVGFSMRIERSKFSRFVKAADDLDQSMHEWALAAMTAYADPKSPGPCASEPEASTALHVPFPLYSKVQIDKDRSIVATVIGYSWSGEIVQANLSWFANGAHHTAWIAVGRLSEVRD